MMKKVNFINTFRLVAILEGLSFIVLLFFAMPMKYVYGEPIFVKAIGMAHGLLFVVFLWLAFYGYKLLNDLIGAVPFWLVVVSSLLPFGTLIADFKYLRRH